MRTYIPAWIDKYSYLVINSTLRQYPAVCRELAKLGYMSNPDPRRLAALRRKKDVVDIVLSELDDYERKAVEECFFKDKRITDADVPMSERSLKRLFKQVILRTGTLMGEL